MIRNYFKIALRNLRRNKTFSIINIAGLATGIGVALLIALWIWDEVSFNTHFKNYDRLAQVMLNQTENGEIYTGATVSMPLGDALRNGHGAEFKRTSLASWNSDHILISGEKKLTRGGMWVQQEFPHMFTLDVKNGNIDALKDPSSVLISSSVAKAMFGNDNPVNKTIRLDNLQDMKVGGVFQDFPHNTQFYETHLLLPWQNQENGLWTRARTNWDNHCGQLYVELNEGIGMTQASAKITSVPTPHVTSFREEALLQPFDKLHLYSEFKNGKPDGGRIRYVWLIATIGIFVLLLACINFMNLSTARSEKRAKEVGIRKAMGSVRGQLITQFLSESVFMALLSFVLALVLVQISLPFFNSLAGKRMTIPWGNAFFWIVSLGFTLFTGIISGSYPALYLSSFRPIKVLKGVFRTGRFAAMPRKVLVVVQFTVSVVLIIGTIVVFRQVQFAKGRDAGYDRNRLISVRLTPALYGRFQIVKDELLQTGRVENVAQSSYSTVHFSNNNSIEWPGKDPGRTTFFRDVNVSHDFGRTVGWQITEGRDFSEAFASDSAAMVVNETAAKTMGMTQTVGQIVQYAGNNYTIIGVARDMLTQSPYDPMEPSVFMCSGWKGVFMVKLKPGIPVKDALAKVETVFTRFDTETPFEFKFISEEYDRKYAIEERVGRLAGFFAVLAVLISCLGLFGLAAFVAEQRVKEISVRKVLGASVFNVWRLLSRDFMVLVIISLLVAVPVAYYAMHNWLQGYAYRAPLSWWIFAAAGMGALTVTIVMVSLQTIRAALTNPVKSLRTE